MAPPVDWLAGSSVTFPQCENGKNFFHLSSRQERERELFTNVLFSFTHNFLSYQASSSGKQKKTALNHNQRKPMLCKNTFGPVLSFPTRQDSLPELCQKLVAFSMFQTFLGLSCLFPNKTKTLAEVLAFSMFQVHATLDPTF